MGVMNKKRQTVCKGTMKHARTSLSTDLFAGAIISMVQHLAPLQYCKVRGHSQEACLHT
jgi:hypothetical protein